MDTKLAEVRDFEQLSSSIEMAKDIITRDYLCQLEKYEVCKVPDELKELEISEYTRLYKFKKFVSDKKENTIDKLVTVLNSAYTSNATVVALVKGYAEYTEYYLGIVSKDIQQTSYDIGTQGETFKGVLTGNFPGLEVEQMLDCDIRELCNNIFENEYITSVSGIASLRNEKERDFEKYVQGIEHLVDSLQGREYSIIVIADPVESDEIALAKTGYENLYTQLSPFLKASLSFNESDTITVSQSHTQGVTKSIGESTSYTQNYSTTTGWSESSSHGTSQNKNVGNLVGGMLGAGIGAAATILTGGLAAPVVAAAAYMGNSIGGTIGSGIIGSHGENTNSSFTENRNTTESSGNTTSRNSSTSSQNSDTDSQSEGSTHGRTLQFENENKTVKDLLDKIDKHIERLNKCEAYGAFNSAAYVISSDPETNAIVSNGYNALMRGDNSALQASYLNTWNTENMNGDEVKEYLRKFSHPLFIKDYDQGIVVNPASMTNSYEMAINIGIPKKSISGLPVFEMSAFGRNVFQTGGLNKSCRKIQLGKIYHMGSVERENVHLNVESLAMHTFITGSTGTGKSNTVYHLLKELNTQKISYLVIESAKGEYKHVFANAGAKVYGTNPYYAPLLKINPFRFPEGIHVLEHVDRLIEIFNVCWPMYAAMPAVLKEAVLQSYEVCGWDMVESVNRIDSNLFPTFQDVLSELVDVIENSAYDREVKSNYKGSLETRIKSLTNGLYGQIFSNNEIDSQELFDSNVIIDLSRVGSIETKSLIMGILVTRLNEYRMVSVQGMNTPLKHVTVLEEAHNILKRTSTEQNAEGANMLGKSVEMLSNSIAEMRTYGEGFIIVDQSPNAVDVSAIRNTNTKIIMRLPEETDRRMAGKSAALKDEQLDEISKLPMGVAVVYQNDWLEPVLCKVNKYTGKEQMYVYKKDKNDEETVDKLWFNLELLKLLLKGRVNEKIDVDIDILKELLPHVNLSTKNKIGIYNLIQEFKSTQKLILWDDKNFQELSELVSELLGERNHTEKIITEATDFENLNQELVKMIHNQLEDVSDEMCLAISQCLLRNYSVENPDDLRIYTEWQEFVRRQGGLA